MRRILMLIALAACGDDAPAQQDAAIDAYPDAPTTPAIDWSIWGGPCDRGVYGSVTCTSTDGVTMGLCIMTGEAGSNGVYPGACRHYCYGQPGHATECPPDGKPVEDGLYSQGCYCERL